MSLNATQRTYLERRIKEIATAKRSEIFQTYPDVGLTYDEMYQQIATGVATLKPLSSVGMLHSFHKCYTYVLPDSIIEITRARTAALAALDASTKKLLDQAYLGDIPDIAEALSALETQTF